jgi:hypothetical protein
VDEGLARRLAKAGARLGVGGVLLLLLTAIFTGLQGPYWRPVMVFGLALIVAGFGFMAVLLIRLRMFLNSGGDIEEYRDLFGLVKRSKASNPSAAAGEPGDPSALQEAPAPKVRWWRRLWNRR